MNEITIKIREDGRVSVEELIGGIRSYKPISPDSLMNCISESMLRGGTSSGLLPKGCLSYTAYDNGEQWVCILHPENFADISYYGTVYEHFPLPKLVFGFCIGDKGQIIRCSLGVIENTKFLKPATTMYHYPFSNVSGFQLCTGNNILPRCESLHTLGSLPYYILSMPNNNDHFAAQKNKQSLEMRDLLEFLKDKQPDYYYSDILIANGATLNDFINRKGA